MRARRAHGRYRLTRLRAAAALACVAWLGCGSPTDPERTGSSGAPPDRDDADAAPVVLFLGDSLTAGYGLPAEEAFPALIQSRIDAAGLDYRVVNAGVSGDTSAGGRRRIEWLARQPIAVLVIALGGNDMLRGLALEALRENLNETIDAARAAHPDLAVLVAGMRAPRNLGRDYSREFDAVFPEVARRQDAALIPFLLEGVAADPQLNQADGIHPTAAGHRVIADTVWSALAPVLRERAAD